MRWRNLLHPEIWIPGLVLFFVTLPFIFTDLDLTLQKLFFRQGWPIGDHQPWLAIYQYGPLPGLILSALALGILLASWVYPALRRFRRPAAIVVLTLALGPGLLVNAVGKAYWGRPRPREITQFGGTEIFHCVTSPGIPGRGKSFPCGHASVGFLFVSLYFILPSRMWRWSMLGAGLAYGTLIGIGRMAQGAHFASDVIWAGGLTYLSAALSQHVLLPPDHPLPESKPVPAAPKRKLLVWLLLAAALAALAAFFLLATPYYKIWSGHLASGQPVTTVRLVLPQLKEEILVQQAQQEWPVLAQAEFQGFGFPKLRLAGSWLSESHGTTLTAALQLALTGLTTERTGTVRIWVRQDLRLLLQNNGPDTDVVIGQAGRPGNYAGLNLSTQHGRIRFLPLPGSIISGPIQLHTDSGELEASNPGFACSFPWSLTAEQGNILITLLQNHPAPNTWVVSASSASGSIAFTGTVAADCHLDVTWDQGQGSLDLKTTGEWHKTSHTISGPTIRQPAVQVNLKTQTGKIHIQATVLASENK